LRRTTVKRFLWGPIGPGCLATVTYPYPPPIHYLLKWHCASVGTTAESAAGPSAEPKGVRTITNIDHARYHPVLCERACVGTTAESAACPLAEPKGVPAITPSSPSGACAERQLRAGPQGGTERSTHDYQPVPRALCELGLAALQRRSLPHRGGALMCGCSLMPQSSQHACATRSREFFLLRVGAGGATGPATLELDSFR